MCATLAYKRSNSLGRKKQTYILFCLVFILENIICGVSSLSQSHILLLNILTL